MERQMTNAANSRALSGWKDDGRIGVSALVLMWVAYAATVACNAGFELLKLGGTTSNQISNEVFSWFTPAGYVFSIWSVIYIGMALWLIMFTRDMVKTGDSLFGNQTVAVFILSCALNIIWLATWHFRMIALSVAVISVLLVTLGVLHMRVFGATERMVYRIPTSLYFAWISVATVANLMHLLTRMGVLGDGLLEPVTTIVLAVLYLALAAFMKGRFGDMVFGLVVVWALVGIGVHLMDASMSISIACFIIAAAGLIVSLAPWGRRVVAAKPSMS